MLIPSCPISVACHDPCNQTAIGKNVGSVAVGIPRDQPAYGLVQATVGTVGTQALAAPPVPALPPPGPVAPPLPDTPPDGEPPPPEGEPVPELPQPSAKRPARTRRDAWFILASPFHRTPPPNISGSRSSRGSGERALKMDRERRVWPHRSLGSPPMKT